MDYSTGYDFFLVDAGTFVAEAGCVVTEGGRARPAARAFRVARAQNCRRWARRALRRTARGRGRARKWAGME